MIEELKWDSDLFGRKIGRIIVKSSEDIRAIIRQAKEEGYGYLTCRLKANEISAVQFLEENGFYLTDIGVIWEKKNIEISEEPAIPVREAKIEDIPMLKAMVVGLFKESRFYHDPFFTENEADMLYQAWIENSVRGFSDKVFLANNAGFITCKILPDVGNIELVGVLYPYRGKGFGKALMLKALKWFKENGVNTVTVRTQASNIMAINLYISLGFYVKWADITMGIIIK